MTGPLAIDPSTPRLLLRPWRGADRAPFAALKADPQTMAFFATPVSRGEGHPFRMHCLYRLCREDGRAVQPVPAG